MTDGGLIEPTLPALLLRNATDLPSQVAWRQRELGRWREYTWSEVVARTAAIAAGLRGLDVGTGTRVALIARARPEWLLVDLAIQGVGGTTVAIDPDIPTARLAQLLGGSASTVVIAEDEEQCDKVAELVEHGTTVHHTVVIDPRGVESEGVTTTLDALETASTAMGSAVADYERAVGRLDARLAATMTSGVAIGHEELLDRARSFGEAAEPLPSDETLSLGSLAALDQRIACGVASLSYRYVVNFGHLHGPAAADLRAVQPTVLYGPAPFWQALHTAVENRMGDASHLKARTYRAARQSAARRSTRSSPSILDRVGRAGWGWVVDRSLREKLGVRRLRAALTDDSPLPDATAAFFGGVGVDLVPWYERTALTVPSTPQEMPA